MKNRLLYFTLLGLGAVPALLRAQGVPAIGAGRVGAQVAAGTLATPLGFVAGGLAFRAVARHTGLADDDISRVADIGAAVGVAVASGGAAALVGARGPGRGSFPAAVGGAAVGTGLSGLLILVSRRGDDVPATPCHVTCVLTTVAIVTLPSIGATVAYDASRRAR